MQERAATARTLVLVRHAKAEAAAPSDHERRLTDRGRADAAEAGRWLAGAGVVPDHALVSDAARAVETWEELAAGAGWDPDCETSAGLYAAGPESALDLMRDCPPEVRTLVVVGHNPTIATLAELLDDGEGDEEASTELVTGGFPTSAAVVLEVDGDWEDLAEAGATVRAFHVGRG